MRLSLSAVAYFLIVTLCIMPSALADAPTEKPAGDAKPEQPVDPIAEAVKQINEQDNGVTVNREANHLDIKAEVCLRRGEFLEMFACTRDSREHESILVIDAMPSTIHFGLLLLGEEPGKPLSYDMKFDPPKLVPAKGPEVGVFIVVKADDVEREIPANRWVQDSKTEKMMEDNTWLFAGSQFAEVQGKQVYYADVNGSAISLVNFGDDLLTLPNKLTDANDSHGKVWQPRTQAIPKVGTKVLIRLKPTEKDEEEAKELPPLPQPKPAEE